jgi:hypothetical protein
MRWISSELPCFEPLPGCAAGQRNDFQEATLALYWHQDTNRFDEASLDRALGTAVNDAVNRIMGTSKSSTPTPPPSGFGSVLRDSGPSPDDESLGEIYTLPEYHVVAKDEVDYGMQAFGSNGWGFGHRQRFRWFKDGGSAGQGCTITEEWETIIPLDPAKGAHWGPSTTMVGQKVSCTGTEPPGKDKELLVCDSGKGGNIGFWDRLNMKPGSSFDWETDPAFINQGIFVVANAARDTVFEHAVVFGRGEDGSLVFSNPISSGMIGGIMVKDIDAGIRDIEARGAVYIGLIHNHPSGDYAPSESDRDTANGWRTDAALNLHQNGARGYVYAMSFSFLPNRKITFNLSRANPTHLFDAEGNLVETGLAKYNKVYEEATYLCGGGK